MERHDGIAIGVLEDFCGIKFGASLSRYQGDLLDYTLQDANDVVTSAASDGAIVKLVVTDQFPMITTVVLATRFDCRVVGVGFGRMLFGDADEALNDACHNLESRFGVAPAPSEGSYTLTFYDVLQHRMKSQIILFASDDKVWSWARDVDLYNKMVTEREREKARLDEEHEKFLSSLNAID